MLTTLERTPRKSYIQTTFMRKTRNKPVATQFIHSICKIVTGCFAKRVFDWPAQSTRACPAPPRPITAKKQEVHPLRVIGSALSMTSMSLLNRLRMRPTGVQSKKPMDGACSTPASSASCNARAAASAPRYSASDDTDTDITGGIRIAIGCVYHCRNENATSLFYLRFGRTNLFFYNFRRARLSWSQNVDSHARVLIRSWLNADKI